MHKSRKSMKPYAMIGAGRLSSALYKSGDQDSGWQYRFNIFRTCESSGKPKYWLRPKEILDLLKLLQVLSSELAADGCMSETRRQELWWVSKSLEAINCYSPEPDDCRREVQ